MGPDQPENAAALSQRSAVGKFPLLVDGDTAVFEATAIIEYFEAVHSGPDPQIPANREAAAKVRMTDRVFDNYVMNVMTVMVTDALRPEELRDPYGVERARIDLDRIYAWLDRELVGRDWTCGAYFTLADSAAALSLFYADWAHPIADPHVTLRAYASDYLPARRLHAALTKRPYRTYLARRP